MSPVRGWRPRRGKGSVSLSRSFRGRGSVLPRPPWGDGSAPAGTGGRGQGGDPPPGSISPRRAWPQCFWPMSRFIHLSSQGCGLGVRQAGDGAGAKACRRLPTARLGAPGREPPAGLFLCLPHSGASRPPCPGSSVHLSQSLLYLPRAHLSSLPAKLPLCRYLSHPCTYFKRSLKLLIF